SFSIKTLIFYSSTMTTARILVDSGINIYNCINIPFVIKLAKKFGLKIIPLKIPSSVAGYNRKETSRLIYIIYLNLIVDK
ncbi:hypothetical protein BO83DRAFT_327505, partial [Aspergillus eucalypticola CBS 122712]